MASIRKYTVRDGEPRYNVHWRAGGKSRERTFTRAKEAEAFKRQVEAEQSNGATVASDPSRGDMPFGVYAEDWLRDRRRADGRPLAPRTKELYESQYNKRLAPTFARQRLNAIRVEDVRRWHSRLAERHGAIQAAKAYRLLRVILNTACEDGRITANPCRIRGAGVERSPERPFVDAGIVLALSDAIEARYRALILLAGFGGLRIGELLALRRCDLDLAANTVRVERQTVELSKGQRIETAPKTDAGRRSVHLPASVSAALAAHLDNYCTTEPDALVFTGPLSEGLRRATLYTAWDKARRTAGLPALHIHDLRHAAGTLAAQTGATTRELMARLGHASPAAAQRYQHAAERRDADIATSLEAVVQAHRQASAEAAEDTPVGPSEQPRPNPVEPGLLGKRWEKGSDGPYPPGVTPRG